MMIAIPPKHPVTQVVGYMCDPLGVGVFREVEKFYR
jgi:hypothetical protein